MDRTPNRDRLQRACRGMLDFLQTEVAAERLTHAEALAGVASLLGLLLRNTDDHHRDKAIKMSDEIITDILTGSPPPRAA